MKLLFEGYWYSTEVLKKYLSSHFYTVDRTGTKGAINFVGYFFNYNPLLPESAEAVFILPKVFISQNNEPFELKGITPEDIINTEKWPEDRLDRGISEMVFELSVWLYQAISFYSERTSNTKILENASIQNVVSNRGEESATYLDTVLQLRKFYKDHRNLITFVSIINNSGSNKIHWGKTLSHEQPVIRENRPAYISFRTKQKTVNYDEDLIVLFFSVLDYLKGRFHFQVNVNIKYTLIPHRRIKGMIESCKGTRYLKSIRKKYFTDDFVSLWKLLYTFFDKAERVASKRYHEETLLAKDFDRVFEDMVDYLISDDDNPKELVEQRDHKFVDHLYHDQSLLYDEPIYFVGDSKYYKPGISPADESTDIYKQYTYAKNIIQRNINVIEGFESGDSTKYFHYRDDVTEGYNITPNFLISGTVQKDSNGKYITGEHQLKNITGNNILYNRHFRNRLFDRDTLLLQKYNINFLYVLTSYAAQQQISKNSFRAITRKAFRDDILRCINSNYDVYQICLVPSDDDKNSVLNFVRRNFYELSGKVFSYEGILLFAEEKRSEKSLLTEDKKYISLPSGYFPVKSVRIGDKISKEYAIPSE